MARIRTSPALRLTPRDRLAGSASGLIGRAAELRELLGAAIRAAVERQGWVGLVGGEPGIGKTRLAAACAGQLAEDGFGCAWVSCPEGDGAPPFWAWDQLLDQLGAGDVAGTRADGRPHATPTWFYWDGERFYVSTTRGRLKYKIFSRDPRAQLVLDDPAGLRAVVIPATVEIREDTAAELSRYRAIREKYGMDALGDQEHLESLIAEGRALLAITPDSPPSAWTCWGFG